MDVAPERKGTHWLFTGATYFMLFLLGAAQGLVGSFQYSHVVGAVPVVALACCVVLLVTCLLAAWAMRASSGALVLALGWLVVSFLMAMPVPSGSLVITGTTPGEWYLYGGTICALLGLGLSLSTRVRGAAVPRR
ncbi:MAG: hypothetical protein ACRDOB_02130 [Streptosporangiaceae bacterium]